MVSTGTMSEWGWWYLNELPDEALAFITTPWLKDAVQTGCMECRVRVHGSDTDFIEIDACSLHWTQA